MSTLHHFKTHGKDAAPLVCLTAYTYPVAALLAPHVDLLLVGDSLGMVLYGLENTQGVTLDMMLIHGRAVVKGAERKCVVVVDMPYGTYEASNDTALTHAKRIMDETGCDAVKLEGGESMAERIAVMTRHDIPVMAHIGLLPQSAPDEGGFKIKGKTNGELEQLIRDAKAVEAAGAFSMVLEGMIEDAAADVSRAVNIPTIGIGASAACNGQILVTDDMLGLTRGRIPKFVKPYADLGAQVEQAAQIYAQEVRARAFPDAAHVYRKKTG